MENLSRHTNSSFVPLFVSKRCAEWTTKWKIENRHCNQQYINLLNQDFWYNTILLLSSFLWLQNLLPTQWINFNFSFMVLWCDEGGLWKPTPCSKKFKPLNQLQFYSNKWDFYFIKQMNQFYLNSSKSLQKSNIKVMNFSI